MNTCECTCTTLHSVRLQVHIIKAQYLYITVVYLLYRYLCYNIPGNTGTISRLDSPVNSELRYEILKYTVIGTIPSGTVNQDTEFLV